MKTEIEMKIIVLNLCFLVCILFKLYMDSHCYYFEWKTESLGSLYYEFGLKAEGAGSLFNQKDLKAERNSLEIQLSLNYESEAERLAGWVSASVQN